MRRAAVIVMDACGVGALPDAASYGDEGTNTLVHLAEQAVQGTVLPVEVTEESWDRVLAVNLKGPYLRPYWATPRNA